MRTFARGIKIAHEKRATEKKEIAETSLPARVVIPLQQNLGCPCDPVVKPGDEVTQGQKIGDSSKFISAPVHASISGKVTKIEWRPNACGFAAPSVIIEGPGQIAPGLPARLDTDIGKLTPEAIRAAVKEAGIVGMGGATFPTHVKLSPPKDKKIDTVIINGCECEPYITIDHRLMLERTEEMLFGARAIAKAVGAGRILIGIEKNKMDAVQALTQLVHEQDIKGCPPLPEGEGPVVRIEISVVNTKYPQGGEKMLIKALLGREVPAGGLPSDVGAVVQNVATAVAITEALRKNTPLIVRPLTVTGPGVKEPKNLYVRIGTPIGEVVEQCGGLADDAAKIIMGGPMTGLPVSSLEMPVVKGTSCILVFTKKELLRYEEGACIRCGKCIKVCPTGLVPNFIADHAKQKQWDLAGEYDVASCIECGCCSYVCPSRIPLVQYFKIAKKELQTSKAVCK